MLNKFYLKLYLIRYLGMFVNITSLILAGNVLDPKNYVIYSVYISVWLLGLYSLMGLQNILIKNISTSGKVSYDLFFVTVFILTASLTALYVFFKSSFLTEYIGKSLPAWLMLAIILVAALNTIAISLLEGSGKIIQSHIFKLLQSIPVFLLPVIVSILLTNEKYKIFISTLISSLNDRLNYFFLTFTLPLNDIFNFFILILMLISFLMSMFVIFKNFYLDKKTNYGIIKIFKDFKYFSIITFSIPLSFIILKSSIEKIQQDIEIISFSLYYFDIGSRFSVIVIPLVSLAQRQLFQEHAKNSDYKDNGSIVYGKLLILITALTVVLCTFTIFTLFLVENNIYQIKSSYATYGAVLSLMGILQPYIISQKEPRNAVILYISTLFIALTLGYLDYFTLSLLLLYLYIFYYEYFQINKIYFKKNRHSSLSI